MPLLLCTCSLLCIESSPLLFPSIEWTLTQFWSLSWFIFPWVCYTFYYTVFHLYHCMWEIMLTCFMYMSFCRRLSFLRTETHSWHKVVFKCSSDKNESNYRAFLLLGRDLLKGVYWYFSSHLKRLLTLRWEPCQDVDLNSPCQKVCVVVFTY